MSLNLKQFKEGFFRLAPLILLIYISISEFHTQFYYWGIFSFNFQFIIIYYWILRDPSIIGYGFVFLCGIINDVVLSLPLGASSLSYLFVSLVAAYVRNATVRSTLLSDWFTFIIAIIVGNFIMYSLLKNFSEIKIEYASIFYDSLFTFILYPVFWLIFELYKRSISMRTYD
tara:strand:- start:7754 stop:8269 length:516 start_codon:yes stop_codon:yes gene_type:complete